MPNQRMGHLVTERTKIAMRVAALPWVLSILFWAHPAAADITTGKLTKVVGKVWVQAPNAAEAAAAAGAAIEAGSRVRTGPSGVAEVTFEDGTLVQVQASSSMQLSKSKREVKKTSVVLFFGKLWSRVTRSGGEVNYEIKTPNATCGVRGTEFTTTVGDDGTARVKVEQGKVAVAEADGDSSSSEVAPGQQVDADENGVGKAQNAQSDAQSQAWQKERQERLAAQIEQIVAKIKSKIMSRKGKLEALQAQEKVLLDRRKQAEGRAQAGDGAATDEIRDLNHQIATIADSIADLGDEADSQFGLVDHLADLAQDVRFAHINRKALEAEAASLRRVKSMLDKMVAEGTDISQKAMDEVMRDMKKGKGSLKEKKGSSAKELLDE